MATDSKPTRSVGGGGRTVHSGAGPDLDVLASQIEKTREDLAVTFDAIADKVSPKRVAHRTSESAKETVAEKSALLRERAAGASETLKEKAVQARGTAQDAAASLRERVENRNEGKSLDGSVRLGASGPAAGLPPAATTGSLADAADAGQVGLEPAGSEVPPLAAVLQSARTSARAPALAGAAAAVLVVLLILRRHRS